MGVVGAEHGTKETFADMSGARRKKARRKKECGGTSVRRESGPGQRYDLAEMIAVGVRRVVLARGELDKLEGPKYAARTEEGRVASKGGRSRESKGSAGGGGVAECRAL